MSITLIEKINRDKLKRVINSDNLPCNSLEDDPDWVFKNQPNILNKLYHRTDEQNNHITTYEQTTPNYGRFKTGLGIQGIQKDVRSYVCGEYYTDIDISNCHPVIIQHIFNQHGVYSSFLDEYIIDRASCIKKYKLDDKLSLIKIINTEVLNNKYNKSLAIKDFHDKLYTLFTTKIYKENKELFRSFERELKKQGRTYNILGSIMSRYLQNIENNLIHSVLSYLDKKKFKATILMFDGVMVEKNPELNENTLNDISAFVKDETGYDVKLSFKSTNTEWKPNENKTTTTNETPIFSKTRCKELYEASFASNAKGHKSKIPELFSIWMEYMNSYICVFNDPHTYGWRYRTTDKYVFRQSCKIKERIGVKYFTEWNDDDEQLVFDKMDFIPNIDYQDDGWVYNNYVRPQYTEPEKDIKVLCPLFFEFINEVICDGYEDAEKWIYNWISQMIRKGFTRQAVVLLGQKGCGKSSFAEIVGDLVGKDYTLSLDNIERVGSNFNSVFHEKILTTVQEIATGTGEYHRLQTIIKSRTTEEDQVIEHKGIDCYKVKSSNNFIFITNEINPIKITSDNRRFLPLRVSTKYQRNNKFFKELKKEVNDNIQFMRYWFIHREYDYSNQENIPTTNCSKELTELNKSCVEKFIDEELELIFKRDPDDRVLKFIYNDYLNFRAGQGDNTKALALKYFKAEIENKTKYYFARKKIGGEIYYNLLTIKKAKK